MNDISLVSKMAVRQMLAAYGIYPKKTFGQNFLVDARVLERILDAAGLQPDDAVLEIGPGLGVLTAEAAKIAKQITAIEIDERLIPILKENLAGFENADVINQDILKTDLAALDFEGRPLKVLANLPYYITTPIIFKLLESGLAIESMVLMVQKEVGLRMMASPGTKAYSALTANLAYYARCSHVANVPPNCFFPRPDVDSAVVRLDVLEKPSVDVKNAQTLFAVIRAAFAMRRKTLQNCLASELSISKESAAVAICDAGLDASVRGEQLSLTDFAKLADFLC